MRRPSTDLTKCQVRGCKRPAATNHTKCQHCLALNRAQVQRYRQRHKILGICRNCSRPRAPNVQYCETCARAKAKWGRKRSGVGIWRISRWNPDNANKICKRLWHYEPYLRRDWDTAKTFIQKHIDLWMPQFDPMLDNPHLDLEVIKLADMFNVYLDEVPNYLENGIRLGSAGRG